MRSLPDVDSHHFAMSFAVLMVEFLVAQKTIIGLRLEYVAMTSGIFASRNLSNPKSLQEFEL
jgi:hypothetical protein